MKETSSKYDTNTYVCTLIYIFSLKNQCDSKLILEWERFEMELQIDSISNNFRIFNLQLSNA